MEPKISVCDGRRYSLLWELRGGGTKFKRQQSLHGGDTHFARFWSVKKSSPVVFYPVPCLLVIQHVIRQVKNIFHKLCHLYVSLKL